MEFVRTENFSNVQRNIDSVGNLCFSVTFKYEGLWMEFKHRSRKRYNGGKQKTIKLVKDNITFDMLREKIQQICPWMRGHKFGLHYFVHGTSPKEYKFLASDIDVREMIVKSGESDHAEIVVITEVKNDHLYLSEDVEFVGSQAIDAQHDAEKTLQVGTRFTDAASFKHTLRSHAILRNFELKITSSDKKRVIATCSYGGCPWRIRASLCNDGQSFEIRRLEDKHLCLGVNRAASSQATIAWVANEVQDIVKKNPDVQPKQLNDILEMTYGLSLPYMKLWRSREQAREMIFASIDDNYKFVPALKTELVTRNPGSHITYSYNAEDNSFERFYVSFKVCIDGFLVGCRPLIGLDACHLKAKYFGVLLSANSLDGNNGLFTLAFAIVETESRATWQWFLENLYISIGSELRHLAFISDMEKDLAEAMRYVFPHAEHRVCLHHLWKNLKKYFHCQDGDNIQNLIWTAANSYTKNDFDKKLFEISKISPNILSYLISLSYKWSRSQFLIEIKQDSNTNNMAESFNSWIVEARNKPVVDLIDMIRGMMMEQRCKRKINSNKWQGELVPHIEEYIKEVTTRKEHFVIRQSTVHKAEVEGHSESHKVDIQKKECSCMFWQITGLPCIHAMTFIGMKGHQLWHIYVDEIYHVTRYKMAYEGAIATLPSKNFWVKDNEGLYICAPNTIRPSGRPKKKRQSMNTDCQSNCGQSS